MFEWAFYDAEGQETGTSDPFPSQADAETWFGISWQTLATDGVTDVALRSTTDGNDVYTMNLAAE